MTEEINEEIESIRQNLSTLTSIHYIDLDENELLRLVDKGVARINQRLDVIEQALSVDEEEIDFLCSGRVTSD